MKILRRRSRTQRPSLHQIRRLGNRREGGAVFPRGDRMNEPPTPSIAFEKRTLGRREFCVGAAGILLAASACRADASGQAPPRLGSLLYDKTSAALRVRVFTYTRGNKRQGRCYVATAPRFEVIPSASIQTDLAFAVPATGDFAAINGGFYDANENAMGFVRHQAKTFQTVRRGGGSGVIVQTPDGARLLHRSDPMPPKATEGLQSIDRLVVGGMSVVGAKASLERDARSAVMIDADNAVSLVAVVADAAEATPTTLKPKNPGRPIRLRTRLNERSSTTGVSLAEFAKLLSQPPMAKGLGALSALNLDGGYSTSFFAHVEGDRFRIEPYRATINAIRLRAQGS